MTPTTQATTDAINKMFNDNACETLMFALYDRWQNEKEYEDIKDYLKLVNEFLKTHKMEAVKMNKRPFGFNFTAGTDAVYQVYMNSTSLGWKRVK